VLLAGLKENITVKVIVPRDGEERDVHEAAVAWRGKAIRDGKSVTVSMDFQGNVASQ
jgi:hypothetical protein